ncbi:hypothetical protein PSECIP111951_01408 [Pseudoalteromonas holothuriae]|uniref:Oxidoreductase n=1 Tax=Pseudoalteromonas holothuriae TaxID=2963714 RepID=A0A9W4VUJ0_9GAMM|nr:MULTISPECIES: SDR family NAD(P)-dependent oxidoreductase [unclassified Pseudoalteromonas]CAH9049378.1 hypothetical protein PSECIP111854_00011 [Pseudoalteromonas sp. CIP111854]CAH9056175.1 hypothetical protein PSECIP111951_01408 [Pseudoalteromonas sp. CIP111951]
MNKTILITGSTDGIGFATAVSLVKLGHTVLLHGRNDTKLDKAKKQLIEFTKPEHIFTYKADLSSLKQTKALALKIKQDHKSLDVIINNAGVFVVPETVSAEGLDVRFVVNTISPYILAHQLLVLLGNTGRIINVSSAAQSSVSPLELTKPSVLSDSSVYAKSKLALTMWSRHMALSINEQGPVIVALNPKSFLGSKMVEQAYGVAGTDLQVGADILVKAALSEEFAHASGLYFDNDIGEFASPHQDALNVTKIADIAGVIETLIQ